MEPIFFIKGLIIGFAMAVPIGPIGIMCIRKTLAEGHSRGLIIGLGAATADSLYGTIAAFGLTFISDVIATQHFWVSLLGGGLLLFLGIRTFRAKRKDPIIPYDKKGLLGSLPLGWGIGLFSFHRAFLSSECLRDRVYGF
jgi:threonine/homoserine/homoserine lactone efflux protein